MADTEEPGRERTLAIVNARVWTGDEQRPWADALFVRGPRIAGVGSSAEIRKRAGAETTIVDAKTMMVLPGAPDGRIATGFPASVIIVERALENPPLARRPEEIVLAIENGVVVVDRDAMAT